MNPITIIIPYYNNELHIEACLNSIQAQTFQSFDLIFIQDASTDGTSAYIESFINQNNYNVKHIKNENNLGVAASRNLGLLQAETEWIYFLDADDTISPFTLSHMYSIAHDYDGVIAPISKFTPNKLESMYEDEMVYEVQNNQSNPTAFLRKFTACGMLLKSDIIKAHDIQFNEQLRLFSDWSFLIEYQKYVNQFIRIQNNGFYYRGEVFDPFNKPNLSKIEFDIMFEQYVKQYFNNKDRSMDIRVKQFIDKKMIERIKRYFNPDAPQILDRYEKHGHLLVQIFKAMDAYAYKNIGLLMKQEIKALKKADTTKAFKINQKRKQSRIIRRLILNRKSRARSLYDMTVLTTKVNKNAIVFESFAGKGYSDSPKYIYEYMYKKYPEYTYYWVLNEPENFDIPGPAIKVKRLSKGFYKAYSESKYWITNARTPLYLLKKPEQIYIQTWHGTPLKRLGNDMKVVRMPGTTTAAYKYNFRKETERWDYMVSPNAYSTEIFKSAFWMNDERMLNTGYPRNDVLTTKKDDQQFINQIKEKLNLPKDKKVIMYAPTWRDDEFIEKGKYKFDLKIDLDNLQNQVGDNAIILLRMHYLIASALDISSYKGFAYDVSSYPDISELYLISDVLITDYSSVFFDYSILKRPTLFFSYDIAKYKDDLRGFYLDYYKDLPGPIFEDAYSLAMALKDIDTLNIKYKKEIEAFHQKFNAWEDGNAAERIVEKVIRKRK